MTLKMRLQITVLLVMALALDAAGSGPPLAGSMSQAVFVQGQDGYHTYRIPALAVTPAGTVLAFAEGRRRSAGDSGKIDLLLKRSTDNGASWSPQQVVWADDDNTCGNPSPVVDRDTGIIWLLMTWNLGKDHERNIESSTSKDTRRVFVTCSSDEGRTWATPREITANVKLTNWTWYATGPGGGIQIQHGIHKGRLIIPCDHTVTGSKDSFSHNARWWNSPGANSCSTCDKVEKRERPG
jgi:sialidase-1